MSRQTDISRRVCGLWLGTGNGPTCRNVASVNIGRGTWRCKKHAEQLFTKYESSEGALLLAYLRWKGFLDA